MSALGHGLSRGLRGVVYAVVSLGLLAWLGVTLSSRVELPDGLAFDGPPRPLQDARLLVDTTYIDAQGERRSEQAIFDAMFAMIRSARELIVIDMFLFNPFHGPEPERQRDLTAELTQSLIDARRAHDGLNVILITDPINTVYGGLEAEHLRRLRDAGVNVVLTRLPALRDSNPSYSGLWRWLVKPLGNDADGGWLPNALGDGQVTLRSYLALLNFKANHRKTVVADDGRGRLQAMVTSANPHSDSSAHSNIALQFAGPAVGDLLRTEQAVLRFSSDGVRIPERWLRPPAVAKPARGAAQIRVVTEQAIEAAILQALHAAGPGDRIRLAMFYLADRDVIAALIDAQARGAMLQVLLDPNRDAFGREKNGVPARPVAAELVEAGIEVRWCDTHGEQCHFKALLSQRAAERRFTAVLGSANFTRRNLDNFNLETDVVISTPQRHPLAAEMNQWFDDLWTNADGRHVSVAYQQFADERASLRWAYRVMEASGWSSF
ncbi:phospholipase D family protein [Abyssibacter sp.]|uniref:phospholipase D family protein n=1 Tax=Abyssibacter sp. TaxID=2320200 RepID=UPI0035149B51